MDLTKRSSVAYNIIRTLGTGSFGTTYLVKKDPSNDDKLYVMKKVKFTEKNIGEISHEISILQKIAKYGCKQTLLCYHDYFVNVETQTMYIITDAFNDGITLAQFIRSTQAEKRFLERSELLKIMTSLMEGLVHLHKIGIGHGDIKPENILIDTHLNTQIIDFGLSCSKHCKPSGTILFASPEILSNISSKTDISLQTVQHADVFSMGIVFYLLANLEFPFSLSGQNPYRYDDVPSHVINFSSQDRESSSNLSSIVSSTSSSASSPYKSQLHDVVGETPASLLYTLSNFYKTRGKVILSFYNMNQTSLDQEINNLIESMLIVETHKEKTRPSSKRVLAQLRKIALKYNVSRATFGSKKR